jgi:hypothetical protein
MIGYVERSRLVKAREALEQAAECYTAAALLAWSDSRHKWATAVEEKLKILEKAALEFAASQEEPAKGLSAARLKREPEEKRFAKAWEEQENLLDYLLATENNKPVTPSYRDKVVAATVVQWLGSPVGQSFLEGLGYKKGKRSGK